MKTKTTMIRHVAKAAPDPPGAGWTTTDRAQRSCRPWCSGFSAVVPSRTTSQTSDRKPMNPPAPGRGSGSRPRRSMRASGGPRRWATGCGRRRRGEDAQPEQPHAEGRLQPARPEPDEVQEIDADEDAAHEQGDVLVATHVEQPERPVDHDADGTQKQQVGGVGDDSGEGAGDDQALCDGDGAGPVGAAQATSGVPGGGDWPSRVPVGCAEMRPGGGAGGVGAAARPGRGRSRRQARARGARGRAGMPLPAGGVGSGGGSPLGVCELMGVSLVVTIPILAARHPPSRNARIIGRMEDR